MNRPKDKAIACQMRRIAKYLREKYGEQFSLAQAMESCAAVLEAEITE